MKRLSYLFWLIPILLCSCRQAVVLDIRSLSFSTEKAIFFGNGQDIVLAGMPDSSISVQYSDQDSAYHWKMFHPVYMMVNDSTMNSFKIADIKSLEIGGKEYQLVDYQALLDEQAGIHTRSLFYYLRLGYLLRAAPQTRNNPGLEELNSLVAIPKNGDYKVILLDRNIIVHLVNGQNKYFSDSGKWTTVNKVVRLNFLRTFNTTLFFDPARPTFHIGDTAYYTSVKSYYTTFGANKITLSAAKKKVEAAFNVPFRTVIPVEMARYQLAQEPNLPLTINQNKYANTYSHAIYTDDFTGNNISESMLLDSTMQIKIAPDCTLLPPGSFTQNRITNKTFLIGIIPLVLIYIFGISILLYFSGKDVSEGHINQSEGRRWARYFVLLFTALFILSLGRIFIGYNLAFTAPYFTFTFPTAIIAAPIILLCVIHIWFIFLISNPSSVISFRIKYVFILVTGCLFAGLYVLLKFEFPFYLDTLKGLSLRHFGQNEVFSKNILGLGLLLIALTLSLMFAFNLETAYRVKSIFNLIAIVCVSLFFWQKISYSVAALLIAVGFFYIIALYIPDKFRLILEDNEPDENSTGGLKAQKLLFFLLAISPPAAAFLIAFIKDDPGYLINLLLFPLILAFILLYLPRYYKFDKWLPINARKSRRERLLTSMGIVVLAGTLFIWGIQSAKKYDPLAKGRWESRLTAFFNFNTVQNYGTRQSEEQAQFFSELSKYTYPGIHNPDEPIHPGISSFIDPVVKNDLSVPFGLIYPFQQYWYIPVIVLIFIWLTLLYGAIRMSYSPSRNHDLPKYFTFNGLIRIFCVCMVVSSGLWLIASYYDVLPFTGRLVYGMGQDSIAELFETIFLFGYMGMVSQSND